MGAQWLSGRVLDSRPKGHGFEPHRRHCVVSLSKNINPSLVLVQPRKTRPFITERLLMGRKELNQTNKIISKCMHGLQACLLKCMFLLSPFVLSVVKMLLKEEVGGHALNSLENYIVDHGKIMEKNMELCF